MGVLENVIQEQVHSKFHKNVLKTHKKQHSQMIKAHCRMNIYTIRAKTSKIRVIQSHAMEGHLSLKEVYECLWMKDH